MTIAITPIKNPNRYFQIVRAEVTGQSLNTAPKESQVLSSYQGIFAIAVSGPTVLNTHPINAPPTKTET